MRVGECAHAHQNNTSCKMQPLHTVARCQRSCCRIEPKATNSTHGSSNKFAYKLLRWFADARAHIYTVRDSHTCNSRVAVATYASMPLARLAPLYAFMQNPIKAYWRQFHNLVCVAALKYARAHTHSCRGVFERARRNATKCAPLRV